MYSHHWLEYPDDSQITESKARFLMSFNKPSRLIFFSWCKESEGQCRRTSMYKKSISRFQYVLNFRVRCRRASALDSLFTDKMTGLFPPLEQEEVMYSLSGPACRLLTPWTCSTRGPVTQMNQIEQIIYKIIRVAPRSISSYLEPHKPGSDNSHM